MSTSATAKAVFSDARPIDSLGDDVDERAVVERLGQRVATGRVDESLASGG